MEGDSSSASSRNSDDDANRPKKVQNVVVGDDTKGTKNTPRKRACGDVNGFIGDEVKEHESIKYTMKNPGIYITEINDNDVLQGRGTGSNQNEGNLRYRSMIESMAKAYVSTPSRKDKNRMVMDVIRSIHASNGRFLHPLESTEAAWLGLNADKEYFVEITDEDATEKAKQAIRYVHYKKRPLLAKRRKAAANVGSEEEFSERVRNARINEDGIRTEKKNAHMEVSLEGNDSNNGFAQTLHLQLSDLAPLLSSLHAAPTNLNALQLNNQATLHRGHELARHTPPMLEQQQNVQNLLLQLQLQQPQRHSSSTALAQSLVGSPFPTAAALQLAQQTSSISSLGVHNSQRQQPQALHPQLVNQLSLQTLLRHAQLQQPSLQDQHQFASTIHGLLREQHEQQHRQQQQQQQRLRQQQDDQMRLQRQIFGDEGQQQQQQQQLLEHQFALAIESVQQQQSQQQLQQGPQMNFLLQHLQQVMSASHGVDQRSPHVDGSGGHRPDAV